MNTPRRHCDTAAHPTWVYLTLSLLPSVIHSLLSRSPSARLGGSGIAQVMEHEWFGTVHWPDIIARKTDPPPNVPLAAASKRRESTESQGSVQSACMTVSPIASSPSNDVTLMAAPVRRDASSLGTSPKTFAKDNHKTEKTMEGKVGSEKIGVLCGDEEDNRGGVDDRGQEAHEVQQLLQFELELDDTSSPDSPAAPGCK